MMPTLTNGGLILLALVVATIWVMAALNHDDKKGDKK